MELSFNCPNNKIQNVQSLIKQHDARFLNNPYPIYSHGDWRVCVTTDHLTIAQSQEFEQELSRLMDLKVVESVRKPSLKVRFRKLYEACVGPKRRGLFMQNTPKN